MNIVSSVAAIVSYPANPQPDNIVPFCSGESISVKPSNKQRGKKSEVYYFKPEDASNILHWFEERGMWLHYMMFTLSAQLARRNGDMRRLTWKHFFDPSTGRFRECILEINEQKTGKYANPAINQAVRHAIELYLNKTGCNPSENDYGNPICLQLTGTHKGHVLSYDGCRKAIKKAAKAVGVEYNVGTHSSRKTFGATAMKLHPKDPRILETISGIYNHSSTRVTEAYTDRTKETVDALYDEQGEFWMDHVVEGRPFTFSGDRPVVSLDTEKLRDLLLMAYQEGQRNAAETDPTKHIEAFSAIMSIVEEEIQ